MLFLIVVSLAEIVLAIDHANTALLLRCHVVVFRLIR